jgi:hypothetical protein
MPRLVGVRGMQHAAAAPFDNPGETASPRACATLRHNSPGFFFHSVGDRRKLMPRVAKGSETWRQVL